MAGFAVWYAACSRIKTDVSNILCKLLLSTPKALHNFSCSSSENILSP